MRLGANELKVLKGAKKLELSTRNLTELPPEIGLVTSLHSLNLYRNELATLPPEIGQLTKIAPETRDDLTIKAGCLMFS